MGYNLKRLQAEVNEVMKQANVSYSVPVSINGRLTRDLGRAITARNTVTKKIAYVRIEFSKMLVESATDETIRDVVLHECAHIICSARYTEKHGHDYVFKAICHEIGTTNDTPYTDVKFKENAKPAYKYEIICPNCGVIEGLHKTCKTVKNISHYHCAVCGSHELKARQNW